MTTNLEKRKAKHISNSHNTALRKSIYSIIKLGHQPIFNILETCENEVFSKVEKKWIKHFRDMGYELYNRDKGNLLKEQQVSENKLISFPVYLPCEQYKIFSEICKTKRVHMTRVAEDGINKFIKKHTRTA
jgi:hypothetical protein